MINGQMKMGRGGNEEERKGEKKGNGINNTERRVPDLDERKNFDSSPASNPSQPTRA